MARIRTIKPEFWDSPGTARASLRARLFFIAMWNYADDWGVGDGHPARLLAFAFPNDESSDVEPRNFRHLAAEVAECFDVQWYEVDGRAFYAIPSWEAHQRTEKKAKRRNPGPDQAISWLYGSASENPPLDRGLASDGKGKRETGKGKGEQGKPSSSDADASDVEEFAPEVYALCDTLADLVRANGHKVETVGVTWWRACERLMRIDGYSPDQIEWVMRWATADEFWQANIRSMSKLREKFSELKSRALAEHAKSKQAQPALMSKAARNAAEYQRLFGGDDERSRGFQALDTGVGA